MTSHLVVQCVILPLIIRFTCSFDSRLPSGLDAELGVPAAEGAAVAAGEDEADVAILPAFPSRCDLLREDVKIYISLELLN